MYKVITFQKLSKMILIRYSVTLTAGYGTVESPSHVALTLRTPLALDSGHAHLAPFRVLMQTSFASLTTWRPGRQRASLALGCCARVPLCPHVWGGSLLLMCVWGKLIKTKLYKVRPIVAVAQTRLHQVT